MQAGKLSRYCVSKLKLRGASERSSATYWNANKEIAMSTIKKQDIPFILHPQMYFKAHHPPTSENQEPAHD